MKYRKFHKIAWFYLLLIVLWTIVISFIGLSSLPLNPLSLQYSHQVNISSILPEGWGFFTRNAREPSFLLYQKTFNQYTRVNKTTSDKSYWFGLLRYSRAVNSELISLLPQIPDSSWQYIKETGDSLDMRSDSTITVHNSTRHAILSGEYLMVSQERLPWAWSKRYRGIVMPYRKINILVKKE